MTNNRRKSIKKMMLIAGASFALPSHWVKPVVKSIALPAHGQSTQPTLTQCGTSPSTLNFTDVQFNSVDTLAITITNSGNQILQINSITSDDPSFSAAFAGPVSVQPNENLNVDINYSCATPGADSGQLTIEGVGVSDQQPVSCNVSLSANCQLSDSCQEIDSITGFTYRCDSIPTPQDIIYDIDDSSGCPVLIINATPSATSGFRWLVRSNVSNAGEHEFLFAVPSSSSPNYAIYRRNCDPTTGAGTNLSGSVSQFVNSMSGLFYTLNFNVSGTSEEVTISDATITPFG